MKKTCWCFPSLIAAVAAIALSGCLGLKPARPSSRYFVLTSMPAAAPPTASTNTPDKSIGVGLVKLPDYLFKDTMAVRKGANEVRYLLTTLWAERLGNGFQRVLAADLATAVPCQVRFSAWRSQDVAASVYVAIDQFDVDEKGRGVLVAWWRVLSPNGEKVLRSGEFRATRDGPSAPVDPDGAVATLSGLVSDLAGEIAQALRETARATLKPGQTPAT